MTLRIKQWAVKRLYLYGVFGRVFAEYFTVCAEIYQQVPRRGSHYSHYNRFQQLVTFSVDVPAERNIILTVVC